MAKYFIGGENKEEKSGLRIGYCSGSTYNQKSSLSNQEEYII